MTCITNWHTSAQSDDSGIVFSRVCVWLSVNTITPEIASPRTYQGIIMWSKGRTSSEMVEVHGWWYNVSDVLVYVVSSPRLHGGSCSWSWTWHWPLKSRPKHLTWMLNSCVKAHENRTADPLFEKIQQAPRTNARTLVNIIVAVL